MKKSKASSKPGPTTLAVSADTEGLTFKINIIVEPPLGKGRSCFIKAGDRSPFRSLAEVPESLRAFVGSPPPPPDLSEWEDEQQAIIDSFSGQINESVQEELARKASEAATDRSAQRDLA